MSCENNFVNTIVKAADAKFGKDITVLDVHELTTLTNYFVFRLSAITSRKRCVMRVLRFGIRKSTTMQYGFFWAMTM